MKPITDACTVHDAPKANITPHHSCQVAGVRCCNACCYHGASCCQNITNRMNYLMCTEVILHSLLRDYFYESLQVLLGEIQLRTLSDSHYQNTEKMTD